MSTNSINPVTAVPATFFPLPFQSSNVGLMESAAQAATFSENALLSALDQSSSQDNSSLDAADLVDISPQAQSAIDFSNLVNSVNIDSSTYALTLTDAQQTEFDAIIAKYKDAAFNSTTYNKILADLAAAGLSAEQLSLQDSTSSLSLGQVLLNALNGVSGDTDFSNLFSSPAQPFNTTDYTQQVLSEWESVSTQFNAAAFFNGTLIF